MSNYPAAPPPVGGPPPQQYHQVPNQPYPFNPPPYPHHNAPPPQYYENPPNWEGAKAPNYGLAVPQEQSHYVTTMPVYEYDEDEERVRCSKIGCIFSFIPLVGFVNFAMNYSAPRGSPRRRLAVISLLVALLFFAFGLGLSILSYIISANANYNY